MTKIESNTQDRGQPALIRALRILVPALGLAAAATTLRPATALAQGFPSGIWTIQDENAAITTAEPTDRYYVNGFNLNWTSQPGAVPDPIANLGHAIWGEGTQRVTVGIIHKLWTPEDTRATNPPPNDEPYAGYLALSFGLIQDTAATRSILALNAGVVGRDAGGQIVQNSFHSVIGQGSTHGWAYQLPSEPAFDLFGAHIWRSRLADFGNGWAVDTLPQLSGMAGLTQVYLQPAVGFRIGKGLDSDFGPPLLEPGAAGGDAYQATRPVVWYLFAGAASKFVGHDEFLQGSDFQTSRGVDPYRVVGTFDAGLTVIWHGLRFTYVQVFQTRRFYGQPKPIHEYGSFSVSATF